jgi:Kef-type K+ transport system membrane component KefB
MMAIIEYLRSEIAVLPILAKFAIGVAIIAIVPPLSRRARLPAVVGLLLSGVLFGPHVLDVFRDQRPVASFLGDLGALLLMFFAGLEIDLKQFRQQALRSFAFGLATTTIPLLLGTVAALWLGYGPVAAIVVGSLLASHTLLGLPIIRKLGMGRIEPIAVTIGATVMSDTLSLIVFALCARRSDHRDHGVHSARTIRIEPRGGEGAQENGE